MTLKKLLQDPPCSVCGDLFPKERADIGYVTCPQCGDSIAKHERLAWCVVPMNKSNYMLVTDTETLKQLNPKRTT